MLVVRLQGGLGNQLFQYAAGLEAAHQRHTRIKLDMTAYGLPPEPGKGPTISRHPDILEFNVDTDIASLEEVANARRVPLGLLGEKLRQFKYKYLVDFYVGNKRGLLSPHLGTYMDGYFQTEKCFLSVVKTVKLQFTLKDSVLAAMIPALDRVAKAGATVSIHVRRGDYVATAHNRRTLDVCGAAYYRNAAEQIRRSVGVARQIVFTDEPGWVRENITLDTDAIFAADLTCSNGSPLSAAQEMMLMAQCSHHIIANSTFSWWGAYLNPSSAKIIVAPKPWNRGLRGYQDVIPEGWILMPVA